MRSTSFIGIALQGSETLELRVVVARPWLTLSQARAGQDCGLLVY